MPGAARFTVEVPQPADGSTRARTGRLELTHGVVETPQFMPVGTNATVKALDPDEIAAAGATIILANTYHLYLRPGHERIERFGGLHQFMAWDRPILTDSGGYQVVSLGDLRIVDEDGVTFRSHIDGSTHRFTPEHAIAVQEALGSDVAVAFDQPVVPSSPREVVADATARTHRWAERSLAAHRREDQALFGIVQGGLDPELRAESTRFIASLPFDGICLGGLAGDETPEQRDATLDLAVPLLADDPRPRYLMGLGSPADLLEAVHRGVDLFNSVLPARVARNGQLWIPGGRLNMRNQRHLDDPAPGPGRLSVPALPALLAGLPGPSVPGRRAARVPPRNLSQPHLHPRLHGQDPSCDPGRNSSRFDAGIALARGPVERQCRRGKVRVKGQSVACTTTRRRTHGLARPSASRSEEEAEGQDRPAQGATDDGASDAGRGHPEAPQAKAGRGRRAGRRGLSLRRVGQDPSVAPSRSDQE